VITLNFLISIRNYFSEFSVFKTPLIGDNRVRFKLFHYLYANKVAFSYPYGEYLYFKGDPNLVLKKLKQLSKINGVIVSENYQEEMLTYENQIVIKPIVYQSFEELLRKKSFRIPGRRKRAIPDINSANSDILKYKEELIIPLTSNVYVLRGIKYMLEIKPSGYALLWIDLYSPPYDAKKNRFLSPREVRELGLMDYYHGYAVIKSSTRKKLLEKILSIICDDYLELRFPDNDTLLFSKSFTETPPKEEVQL